MKKLLWILIPVLAILSGCDKSNPSTPAAPKDPETPETPQPPYTVVSSEFSTTRDELNIGGFVFTPEELTGKKPAIILCTGLDGTWFDTEPYAKAATRLGYVSCCFDFCGGPSEDLQSLSDGEKSENTLQTELDDLAAVYEAIAAREDVDPDNIILMGGSQGGLIVGLYAARNPSAVTALGLLFPAFNLPDLVRSYSTMIDLIPDGGSFKYQGHVFYKKYLLDAMTYYPMDEIGDYEGPVLIIHGDKDNLVPVTVSQEAAEIYKDAKLIVVSNQGHGFDTMGTNQAIKILEEFLPPIVF